MRIRNPPKLNPIPNLKAILPHRRESEDEDNEAFSIKRGGIVIGMKREGAKELHLLYRRGQSSSLYRRDAKR